MAKKIPQSHTADQQTASRGRPTERKQSQDTRKTMDLNQPAPSSPSR